MSRTFPNKLDMVVKTIRIACGQVFKFLNNDGSNIVELMDDGCVRLNPDGLSRPTAAVGLRGAFFFVPGATSARDRLYQCMKSDADAYSWIEIANGGV